MDLENYLPAEIINFVFVLLFSLLIGMGQRRHHLKQEDNELFGTDRTFAFIGLLGYVLYLFDQVSHIPFLIGFAILGLLISVQYFQKIKLLKDFGLTSSVLALLTFCLPIMVYTQPIWLVLSFVVAILILTEMKSTFRTISEKASQEEFTTLAKFIAFAGIILPLLPTSDLAEFIPVSAYQIWLAIVVVSGVSYVSYLIKKFVFPKSGILLTGFLGGIYSSTATTIILARREKAERTGIQSISAILLANGMMYLRVLVLAFVFNGAIGKLLVVPFLFQFFIAFGLSRLVLRKPGSDDPDHAVIDSLDTKNPLELKTATIFGVLFVGFGLITQFVMEQYGSSGVAGLAFVVGLFDVDPFLLYLLQQNSGLLSMMVALAVINATNSNNVMKMIYAWGLVSKTSRKVLMMNFLVLIVSGLILSVVFYYIYR
ncbi:MgtC/SapB family protein [Mangrovibacterium sp.]|uniref:MgtC/SapB family protein n=1 Tax=Mangrovibacterium sp. TaxID=1961364 RepID=UPI0035663FD0